MWLVCVHLVFCRVQPTANHPTSHCAVQDHWVTRKQRLVRGDVGEFWIMVRKIRSFKNVFVQQTPEKKTTNEQRSRKRKGDAFDSNSQGENGKCSVLLFFSIFFSSIPLKGWFYNLLRFGHVTCTSSSLFALVFLGVPCSHGSDPVSQFLWFFSL